jgi:tRNA nucleotidyltransferase/poly(A) polymerase
MKNNIIRNMFLYGVINESQEMSFAIDLPKEIQTLNNAFKQSGYKLYIVGGAVRDVLLRKVPKDYDFTTAAKPEEVVNILNNYGIYNFPKGEAFGVVSAVINGEEFEIATFRSDETKGRHPEVKIGVSIESDAARRDLRINALYYDIENSKIIDLVGGLDDLKNGVIQMVGNPQDRFEEDPLRILRFFRFFNRF